MILSFDRPSNFLATEADLRFTPQEVINETIIKRFIMPHFRNYNPMLASIALTQLEEQLNCDICPLRDLAKKHNLQYQRFDDTRNQVIFHCPVRHSSNDRPGLPCTNTASLKLDVRKP